jgi:hypothetical protein
MFFVDDRQAFVFIGELIVVCFLVGKPYRFLVFAPLVNNRKLVYTVVPRMVS